MYFKLLVILFACTFIQITCEQNDDDDLVVQLTTPNGKIRGHELESAKGQTYYAFQQIPYAKPPVGEKRFMPPELHDGWDGILNCTNNTKICYQFTLNLLGTENTKSLLNSESLGWTGETEDCLYLNVYTPVKPGTNASLPVYLFIHGGGFVAGTAIFSEFGPKYLIDGDIVVVTLNYRLGPLGFLSTGDTGISGNMGLKDQHLAIQWTYDNIQLFGGNPQDIVVGGESAGSFAVGQHLLSPKTKGLVSGFIQQSGSHMTIEGMNLHPRKYAFELGRNLNSTLSDEDTVSLIYTLQNASAEEIVEAANLITSPDEPSGFIYGLIWSVVIEDSNSSEPFLTSLVYDDMLKGKFNKVPSFIGFNSEESLLFMPANETLLEMYAAQFDTDPSLLVHPSINVDNRTLVGEKLKDLYTNSTFADDIGAFITFTSDTVFVRSSIRQAEITSESVPVYLYELSAGENINEKYPGVAHSLDLSYFWESSSTYTVDEEVREIALKLWWNFIKYKNPTPEIDPALQNIEWPLFESGNMTYLNLNYTLSIETNPRNYRQLRDILLEYMKPPFFAF